MVGISGSRDSGFEKGQSSHRFDVTASFGLGSWRRGGGEDMGVEDIRMIKRA
jgi:hypothetical protein